jgi:hypothetical protein
MSSAKDPEWVDFYQYETQAAMTKAFRSFIGGKLAHSDDCEKKEGETGWTLAMKDIGIFACYLSEKSDRAIVWTHDDLKILSIAESEKLSSAKFTAWWQKAGPG